MRVNSILPVVKVHHLCPHGVQRASSMWFVSLQPWASPCRSHHRSWLCWTAFHNGSVDRWITVLPRAVSDPPRTVIIRSQDFSRWTWVACGCLATYCKISLFASCCLLENSMLLMGSVLAFFSLPVGIVMPAHSYGCWSSRPASRKAASLTSQNGPLLALEVGGGGWVENGNVARVNCSG